MSFLSFSFPTRARSLFAIAALAGMCTCDSIDNFDVDIDSKATIPKATVLDTVLGLVTFGDFDKIDLSHDLKNQGVTKDDVDSVKLKTMTLTIEAPDGQNFDFLTSLSFFAEAGGLDKVQIASLAEVPKGKRELELVINSDVDLKPYVVAPSMTVSSQIKGSRPKNDTTVSAHVVLDVDVHIPGCN